VMPSVFSEPTGAQTFASPPKGLLSPRMAERPFLRQRKRPLRAILLPIIERPDGKPVEYSVAGSSISMEVPITRAEAEVDTKFSMPALSHTFKIDDGKNANNSCVLKLGVQMDLAMYFHILIQGWSLKDLHCRVNPTVNLSSEFNIDWISDSDLFGTEIPFIIKVLLPYRQVR